MVLYNIFMLMIKKKKLAVNKMMAKVAVVAPCLLLLSMLIGGDLRRVEAIEYDIDVNLKSSLSVNVLKSKVILEGNNSDIKVGKNTVEVVTNNENGYKVLLQNLNSSNSLDHYVFPETIKIESITSQVTRGNFPARRWGVSKDGNNFLPVPNNLEPLLVADIDEFNYNQRIHDVFFASRVDQSVPSGKYEDTLMITVVVKDPAPATFSGITKMQEMTGQICTDETTPSIAANMITRLHSTSIEKIPETILTDERDGNKYLVRKLADGSCWMAQDLRLGNNKVALSLTAEKTDIDTAFSLEKLKSKKIELVQSISSQSGLDNNGKGYSEDGYGEEEELNEDFANPGGKIGHYYNWFMASAGNVGDSSGQSYEANRSICPKGWTLPSADANKIGFTKLALVYLPNLATQEKVSYVGQNLRLQWSMDLTGSSEALPGNLAQYWTSSVVDGSLARYFNMSKTEVSNASMINIDKIKHLPVRCVARQ